MRHTISKMIAAFAVVAASAAPAMACGSGGGLFTSGGCSPCGQAYVSPCGQSYNTGYGYGYAGAAAYERLPDPTPVTRQYYYADQGPTFSGPGQFAPVPTYQETAIGWRGYPRYDGGPYANPIDHYSYAPVYRAPVAYTYQSRLQYPVRPSYRYGYNMRPRMHYGYSHRSYAPRYGYRQSRHYAAPGVMYAPRRGYHQAYQHQRSLHRAY